MRSAEQSVEHRIDRKQKEESIMKQVIVSIPLKEQDKERFTKEFPDYKFTFCEKEELKDYIVDANIVVGQPLVEEMVKASCLEWVQLGIAGADRYVNNPDFPRNVQLTNVTGAFGLSISEYLLTMILSLYKKMPAYQEQQKEGIWKDRGKERTLFGKTVLIVGIRNLEKERSIPENERVKIIMTTALNEEQNVKNFHIIMQFIQQKIWIIYYQKQM